MGYTVSIAAKMKALARPDQIIVGQLIYDMLDNNKKAHLKYCRLVQTSGITLVAILEIYSLYIIFNYLPIF